METTTGGFYAALSKGSSGSIWEFPKIRGTLFGVLIVTTVDGQNPA